MLERLDKSKRNIGLAAVAALLVWGGWAVRSVLNPLILGYLFAYILRPSVKGLETRGLGRRSAVNVIFSAFAVVMTVTVLGVAFQAQQATERLMAASRSGHDPIAVAEARIDEVLEGASDWLHGMFGEDEPGPDGPRDSGGAPPSGSNADLSAEGPTLRKLLRSWSAEFTA